MLGITELLLVLCLIIVFMLIALVDILKNDFKGNDKLIWLIVVIFLPVIGAICYFIIGKKQKISGNKGVGKS